MKMVNLNGDRITEEIKMQIILEQSQNYTLFLDLCTSLNRINFFEFFEATFRFPNIEKRIWEYKDIREMTLGELINRLEMENYALRNQLLDHSTRFRNGQLCKYYPIILKNPRESSLDTQKESFIKNKETKQKIIKREEEKEKFVYFITDGEFLKIGLSNNPKRRLRQLQTSNPRKLKLLGKTKKFFEDELHSFFHKKQVQGEWFKYDKKVQVKLEKILKIKLKV